MRDEPTQDLSLITNELKHFVAKAKQKLKFKAQFIQEEAIRRSMRAACALWLSKQAS